MTSAVRSYIGLNRSVRGTSESEKEDRKIVGKVVGYSVTPGGNDGNALVVHEPKADDSKQMSPMKETAGRKGATDLTPAGIGIAVVLTIGESPTLSKLRILAFRNVDEYQCLHQRFVLTISGRRFP